MYEISKYRFNGNFCLQKNGEQTVIRCILRSYYFYRIRAKQIRGSGIAAFLGLALVLIGLVLALLLACIVLVLILGLELNDV